MPPKSAAPRKPRAPRTFRAPVKRKSEVEAQQEAIGMRAVASQAAEEAPLVLPVAPLPDEAGAAPRAARSSTLQLPTTPVEVQPMVQGLLP